MDTLDLVEKSETGRTDDLEDLCRGLGIPFYRQLPQAQLPQDLINRLDVAWARKNRLVPIQATDDSVMVAFSDPMAL
ncbi:MAG: hypothetical protein JRD68_02540, partial [Deltaproteobacteria bacterium]|nr:hypothetical protein [Deltaproteobacteria bacterium]